MYTVDKTKAAAGTGGINGLHQRFRKKEVAIFQKHGAQIVGVWQHLGNPDTLCGCLPTATARTARTCGQVCRGPRVEGAGQQIQRADHAERIPDERG